MNADIESGLWWQQEPPTLHQSETCYVHHSLADIDTKKLFTGEINQVGWPDCAFFQDPSELLLLLLFLLLLFLLLLLLATFFCQSLTGPGWVEVKDPIGTMREFMLFWVALINNWYYMDGERFNFLQSDWGRPALGGFSPVHTIQLRCTPGPNSGETKSIWRRASKPRASQFSSRIPFHFLLLSKCVDTRERE